MPVATRRKNKASRSARPKPSRERPGRGRKHEFIVVANRLPVHRVSRRGESAWKLSPGGLVSALAPLLRGSGGCWVGWEGRVGEASPPFMLDGFHMHPVPLRRADVDEYYYGFSNGTLWPLYHDAVRWPEYHRTWWHRYLEVNERFAEAVASIAARGARVWVHDYHLQLLPAALRRLRPDLRLGFFLHTSFPPQELFAQLPWRREILEGLLGADVVGFQTKPDAQNFMRLARHFAGARGTGQDLQADGRAVRVDAYPVSIDFDRFETLARDPKVLDGAQRFRQRLGAERSIVLGVDRLDYTKGIDLRLKAYRELLTRGEFSVDDAILVQCAVPSRENVATYGKLKNDIEMLVGGINGEFGEVGTVAVHYLHRNHTPEQLASLYCAADVMLVTPLRDGMNLVAKEYIATRTDHTGVLVLSEFTGAAHELRQALLVNPHDVNALASTLQHALTMPRKEAARRMRVLRATVRDHDVHDWGRDFLSDLTGSGNGR